MAYDEHEQQEPQETEGGLYASTAAATPQRSALRRKQVAVGIAGAAAVLAGAGFLATQLMDEGQPSLPEPAALAPQSPASDEIASEEPEPSVTRTPRLTKNAAPVERSPMVSPEASRQASPDPHDESRAADAVEDLRERLGISQRTYVADRAFGDGTIRVVTARRDLSGEREMQLAGDAGEPAGDGTRCTSDITSQPEVPLGGPATMLCWRMSATRSVITMTSAARDESLAAECADVISQEWARLE
ncbi:hypothetical protein Ait01nite_060760 [Actinoplanes italicus]|uniref:Uncharacterized protein n=2 Tax=Actinoplanes italicus TaxID=113567 RepID=A0A2T0K6Q7_9ACTN|nr:hypothetical protein CLV67_112164 [Actinoplanes italicus]GIE33031.1 hypothetical protein Ait01nite_060760 [Actinoplanes italicus]